MTLISEHARNLADAALDIGAIKINTENPFTWASGYRMPMYNDNRLLLGKHTHRLLVAEGLQAIIKREHINADVIAGVATAGIPHATTLANLLQTPLVYVRDAPKAHGMKNRIEGPLEPGKQVVVVEDLVSTGKSSIKAVQALKEAGAHVDHCLCIFSYGFAEALNLFQENACRLHPLLTLTDLLSHAGKRGLLSAEQTRAVQDWVQDPFNWGQQRGFPKNE
jgi:orotate phosphoribosyltransferase